MAWLAADFDADFETTAPRTAEFRESGVYRELEAAAETDLTARAHLASVDVLLDQIDVEPDAQQREMLWEHVVLSLRSVPSVLTLLELAWDALQ